MYNSTSLIICPSKANPFDLDPPPPREPLPADNLNPDCLDKDFTYDGIHLNAFGYQYWVSKIDSEFDYIN